MFIKSFDMLSPPITLYFQGKRKHNSIFSAILTIISYILIFICAIYFLLEFVQRKSPTAYFFNRYIEDAGVFPVNATSMFHFIQMMDIENNKAVPFDFQSFRVVGFDEVMADSYNLDDDCERPQKRIPTEFNHWLYGPCNNSSDTEGIGYLIDFKYFENSACIRKYYDKSTGKYYETDDPHFRWPIILKGCSHPDRTYYGIIMEKCHNDEAHDISGYSECKTDDEISSVINRHSITLFLVDHYADALNYEVPFEKYFYAVTTALTANNFAINHLNFNPASMITHNGLFFDNIVKINSYFFTQNEKQIMLTDVANNVDIHDCLLGFYFWMQNSLQYYERIYKRFQDILSSIGGINSIVILIAEVINFIVRNYIILLDTEELVLKALDNNFQERDSNKKPTILRKAHEVLSPPKRLYYQYSRQPPQKESQSSNYQRLMKDGIEIYQNNFTKQEKSNKYINYRRNKNENKNFDKNIINIEINNLQNYEATHDEKLYKTRGYYSTRNENKLNPNREIKNEIKKNEKDQNKVNEKRNFSYFDYIKYVICCKKNNPKMLYYEDFRNEIISEENLIQNYTDIYQLLKIFEIEKRPSIVPKQLI